MAYKKWVSIIIIASFFFSCTNETTNNKEVTSTEVSENKTNPEVEGYAFVITRGIKSKEGEDVIAEFNILNDSLDKYFIVHYNPTIHQTSEVLLSKQPLTKELFNDTSYIFVQHVVKNYEEWEKKFLIFEDTRKIYEIKVIGVLNHHDDPNNVTVIASFNNLHLVNRYGDLIVDGKAMEDAGVVTTPEILLMAK